MKCSQKAKLPFRTAKNQTAEYLLAKFGEILKNLHFDLLALPQNKFTLSTFMNFGY